MEDRLAYLKLALELLNARLSVSATAEELVAAAKVIEAYVNTPEVRCTHEDRSTVRLNHGRT